MDEGRRYFRAGDRVEARIGRKAVTGEVMTYRLVRTDGSETQLLNITLDDGRGIDAVPADAVTLAAAKVESEHLRERPTRLVDVEAVARRAIRSHRASTMVSIDEIRALAQAYLDARSAYADVADALNQARQTKEASYEA